MNTTTAPAPPAAASTPAAHEHGWTTESAHRTSAGTVRYVRCACGARRVDLTAWGQDAPRPASTVVTP